MLQYFCHECYNLPFCLCSLLLSSKYSGFSYFSCLQVMVIALCPYCVFRITFNCFRSIIFSIPEPVFFFSSSQVMARRKEGSGKVKVLLHWTPEDILPDVWVNETERSQLNTKVVHLSQLPQDSAMLLDPNIYRALPQKRLKRSL
ncbi:zinc finger protein AEBP2-like [Salvelinus fontinalis]|uniref:zinc finger protein AEBP2-like n=1 Tax=Salvelinus fontinalis TaxID=8038 RepID=UPI0024850335|nr:zinc finger protein AEBP2-like [Salvelinus fontinalis]